MRRNSALLMLVLLLLGVVLVREPRLALAEDWFLGWLLRHTQIEASPVPLTVVDIAQDSFRDPQGIETGGTERATRGIAVSPLEFALFLQSVLDFKPDVVAFENVLRWRDRDKDQEQIFLDQA